MTLEQEMRALLMEVVGAKSEHELKGMHMVLPMLAHDYDLEKAARAKDHLKIITFLLEHPEVGEVAHL